MHKFFSFGLLFLNFFILQFNLSFGMLGLTYFGIELVHAVGIFSAGPITDKLVRHLREGCVHCKLVSFPDPPYDKRTYRTRVSWNETFCWLVYFCVVYCCFVYSIFQVKIYSFDRDKQLLLEYRIMTEY